MQGFGDFEAGEVLSAVLLELFQCQFLVGMEDDECFRALAPLVIRYANDGRFGDAGDL